MIGTNVVQRLWPERPAYKPIGETILINGRPFTIVGVFEFYESEEMKRKREMDQQQQQQQAQEQHAEKKAPARGKKGSRSAQQPRSRIPGRGFGLFDRKNSTIIIPITTMFWEFKSASVTAGIDQGPDRKLDSLSFQIRDVALFHEAIDQVAGLMKQTHRGIEDFSFNTREEWFDTIEKSVQKHAPQRRHHRRHLAARWRHRHHEYHARLHH